MYIYLFILYKCANIITVSIVNTYKLQRLLEIHVPNTPLLSSWMVANGYSYQLQRKYKQSNWLEALGSGAFKRPSEEVNWQGAMYSIQLQAKLPVHIGGLTALSLHGVSHYIRTGKEVVYLFSDLNTKLPTWFAKYPWHAEIVHTKSTFLPFDLGLTNKGKGLFPLIISSVERAFFECLYHAPDTMDLIEAYHILSGLMNLRPRLLNKLLEQCTSIKVKRLFLFMAEKANHQWFSLLKTDDLDLGSGDRSVVKNGMYNSKYRITVPKEIEQL